MELVLCTGNEGKLAELRALLPAHIHLRSLKEFQLPTDLPETGDTLEANAYQKARWVHARCGLWCVADDTGLEVDALDGAPGVYSARYAGPERDAQANMHKLLAELDGRIDRRARFRTVLACVTPSSEFQVEGVVQGRILREPRGLLGFGYDPIFEPDGHDRSFAEMPLALKNSLSHRGRAVRAFMMKLSASVPEAWPAPDR